MQLIGEGGMGQVWMVRDLELQINVAIKILHPRFSTTPPHIELLKNECRNTRRLVHPHIVRVFDFHRTDDLVFISMEYIDGQDLAAHRRQSGNFRHLETISLLQPVVGALGYAHDRGLIHRDVKSGNILLDPQNSPRLTDFGIAGIFKTGEDALHITSGGSLYCMSPQQLDGNQPQPADDIYALGVLMYELLTGRPPFYPEITPAKIRHEIPLPLNQKLGQLELDINIPGRMEELIAEMLAKTPHERPTDMQAVGNTLQEIQQDVEMQTLPPESQRRNTTPEPLLKSETEIIMPQRVSVKDKKPIRSDDKRRHFFGTLGLVSAFLLVLAGGGWLLHYLSNHPVEPVNKVEPKIQPMPQPKALPAQEAIIPPPETEDPAKLAAAKQTAEQKMVEYLNLKSELDNQAVAQWGGSRYTEMIEHAKKGDQFLLDQAYGSAAQNYSAAIAEANTLADQSDEALEKLLEQGHQALDEDDGARARENFRMALMIDAQNATAQHGLKRAKTIEAVMQLMASGRQHENNNKLSFAHTDYEEAMRLDPESEKVRRALNRVKTLIKEQEFAALMSEGLTALHNNDYPLARTKLLQAKSFKPDSQEIRDALNQVDEALRLARIEKLRQTALAAEKTENWKQALSAYLEVLQIDGSIEFASVGKQRSVEQIQIAKRIKYYLEKPDILASDRQLKNAILLLNQASQIKPQGAQLAAQIKKLSRLVDAAKTPIKVTIASDNFTDVAVYKIARLGRFSVKELNLKPGTYTVVGARDGYQDVRQKIVIKPGQKPVQISIICKVKL
jgi:serine/threonine protein kinase